MKNTQEIISVNVTPQAKAMWATLGTEYATSFLAIKELFDNSISASQGRGCKVITTIEEMNESSFKISIEDNSGGVTNPSTLLTIASESCTKVGKYNYYGYGLKNALAYFQPKYDLSDWVIQSKTQDDILNDEVLQIRGPYVYNEEFNEEFGHYGMNIIKTEIQNYKGKMVEPGTYIEFQTSRHKLINMHPIKKGRKSENIASIAQELADLVSFYYRPLIQNQELSMDIKYCGNDGKRNFKTIKVVSHDLPILNSLKVSEMRKKTESSGHMNIKCHYFQINRDTNSPYEFSQQQGMLLYINGILVEPYKWENLIFGGNVYHPSMNSLVCYVEVTAPKESTPELSVSKTKIQETGTNYEILISALNQECPDEELDYIKNAANTVNEIVKRDRRYDTQLREQAQQGFICDLQKERGLKHPNGKKGNENLKIDIFYRIANQKKIVIEEFKKDKINSMSLAQVLIYNHLLKLEFPEHHIELRLVSRECQETAKQLIESFKLVNGIDIVFKSFNSLGLS